MREGKGSATLRSFLHFLTFFSIKATETIAVLPVNNIVPCVNKNK